MDQEIRDNLQEISKQVQAVGRRIGSTRIDSEGLKDLSDALKNHAESVKIYARITKN